MNQEQISMRQAKVQKSPQRFSGEILDFDWPIWFFAFIFVWTGLGTYGVLNNNEGLYAYIPFDMLHSGDVKHWIIPHLNGLPYMEKPPLLYWLTAIAFFLFGQAEWVVRLVPTLSGLACVGLMLHFGQRINRLRVSRLAALMFISGAGVTILSRTLVFDMLLTAFLTAALLFSYLFQLQGRKVDLYIVSASLACAVLTKGLVALILFGLVLMAWIVFVQGLSKWKQLSKWIDPIAISLFLAITVPWFVAASVIEPVFLWFFFVNEHVLRFLGQRIPHDFYSGPWWYYLPRMIIYFFPWSLLVPIALCSAWSQLSQVERQELNILRKTFFMGWLLPLIFFSLSSAKANYYLVVAMPFATLHLALLLEQSNFLAGKKSLILGGVLALIASTLAITMQFFPNLHLSDLILSELAESDLVIFAMPLQEFALMVLWFVTGLSLLAALAAWRYSKLGLVAYIVIPLFFLATLLAVIDVKDISASDQSIAKFIQQTLPNRSVYLYRHFEQDSSLAFYLKKPLKIIDSVSNDLYWGNKLRPENNIMISSKQFEQEKEPAAVVVPIAFTEEFKKAHTKFIHTKQFSHVNLFY